MRKNRSLISVALAFLLAVPALAQESVEEIVKKAPSRGKYPDASGVVVRFDQSFRLAAGGTTAEERFLVIEVFSVRGREKYSDYRIPFDKNSEKVDLILARTYKPDLTTVEVEKGAINDLTPPELSDADMYANVMHRVLSFPAVDPGACLAVRYAKENRDGHGNLDEVVTFQTDDPIQNKRLEITIPEGKVLKYRIIGLAADFSREAADTGSVYKLEANDSPPIKAEEFMPPRGEIAARIVFTTNRDWNEASGPFARSFEEALKTSAEAGKLAAELTKGLSSEDEKIRKIFLFVAREVRSVRLNFGEGGYAVNAADAVLRNRYGDWKDKSVLLAAMLKAVGVEAFPVLAGSDAIPLAEDVPSLKQFDCVLIAVPRGGGYLFLDSFADDSQYGYFLNGKGAKGLIVKPGAMEIRAIECLPGTESVSRAGIKADLLPDGGIRGKVSLELSGVFDRTARRELKDKTANEMKEFYDEAVNKLLDEGQALENRMSNPRDLTKKITLSQEFKGESYGIFQGAIMLVNIPRPPYGIADLPSMPSQANRSYPFRLSDLARAVTKVELKLPAGFAPVYIPEGFKRSLDCGEFSLSASYDVARNVVVIEREMSFTKKDVPVAGYDEFKKALDEFGILRNTLILLEKK